MYGVPQNIGFQGQYLPQAQPVHAQNPVFENRNANSTPPPAYNQIRTQQQPQQPQQPQQSQQEKSQENSDKY